MTFDEMIKEKQTAAPDKIRDNPDKTTGLPEGDDYSLELLQWYLKIILECVQKFVKVYSEVLFAAFGLI